MSDLSYKEIDQEQHGQRLDNYLICLLKGVPKSHIYRLIRSGQVRVNKKRAQAGTRLCMGDSVRIPPVRVATSNPTVFVGDELSKRLTNSIVFEDSSLLVINKPSGIAVHGGSGLSLGVIEAFRVMRPELRYLELVHRLDKETSGCLLLAKKRSVLRAIQALFESHEIKKIYWALGTHTWQGKKKVTVNMALKKNCLKSGDRVVQITEDGKASETEFRLLENFTQACWLEARPKTGRTHQIRVHCAYLDHAIVGDKKYGKRFDVGIDKELDEGLYLHARSIQFTMQGVPYYFEADLDNRFAKALKQLRQGA